MTSGMYVSNIDDRVSKGYLQKVFGQVQSFINADFKMTLLRFKDGCIAMRRCSSGVINNQPDQVISKSSSAVHKRIQLLFAAYRILKTEPFDFVYVRYTPFDPFLLLFLLITKIKFSRKINIYLEIPTYPYDKQYLSRGILSFQAFQLLLDYCSRYWLFLAVDRFVIVNCISNTVFNVPVFSITNGVRTIDYPLVSNLGNMGDPINFVFVGNSGIWHGLDRLIFGFAKYYKKFSNKNLVKVRLFIVGGGNLDEIRSLCLKYEIDNCVTFQGPLVGAELDEVMKLATIGVGVLGSHRLSTGKFSPLKHREYCARGLPFIFDGNDSGFTDADFVMSVGRSEEPIDITEVVAFVDRLRCENDLPLKIRAYAEDFFDWTHIMKEVVSDIVK